MKRYKNIEAWKKNLMKHWFTWGKTYYITKKEIKVINNKTPFNEIIIK